MYLRRLNLLQAVGRLPVPRVEIEDDPQIGKRSLTVPLLEGERHPIESGGDILRVELEDAVETPPGSQEIAAVASDPRGHHISRSEVREALDPLLHQRGRLIQISLAAIRLGQGGKGPPVRVPVGPVLGAKNPDLPFERLGHGRPSSFYWRHGIGRRGNLWVEDGWRRPAGTA